MMTRRLKERYSLEVELKTKYLAAVAQKDQERQ
jgi:hypothetical protein